MSQSLLRLIGGAVIVGSVATLAVAAPELIDRIREGAQRAGTVQWAAKTLTDDNFVYRGDPVALETKAAEGGPVVEIRWRDAREQLPVTGPEDPRLPELLRHNAWLRVLLVVPVDHGQTPDDALLAGAESSLVVVGRGPASGYTPETWARTVDAEWRYTFVRLDPARGFEKSTLAVEEIQPESWQAAAAFAVAPELARSTAVQVTMRTLHVGKAPARDRMRELGWTWTASGLSVMGIVVGGMLFGASFLGRPEAGRSPR